jgi:hypothetical protein
MVSPVRLRNAVVNRSWRRCVAPFLVVLAWGAVALAGPVVAQPAVLPTPTPTPEPPAAIEPIAAPGAALVEEEPSETSLTEDVPNADEAAAEVVLEADPVVPIGEADPGVTPGEPTVHEVQWRPGDDCDLAGVSRDMVERSQNVLLETFCEATLWLDGLFGGEPDLRNARDVAGRIEVSALETEMWGTDTDLRLRLNYDLPTLEKRLKLFLGRDDPEEFVSDRREGLAVRSSVFAVEGQDRWLAGLGWAPPGRYREKLDFRVGGRVSSSPEIFVQGRYRQNVFVGESSVWRLRETIFWENEDGFGSTTAIDYDRVLQRNLLGRFSNVGTWSEASQGLEWRSATVVYRNLNRARAAAAEVFARGATDSPVKLREYGARIIYRHPLMRRSLFGEVIAGYTWPREFPEQKREGSAMFGIGIELLFGRDPY